MLIGGFQKFSMIDYPGKIAAVVFTLGCNFRCHYCHNPELVDPQQYAQCLSESEILSFLDTRKGKLDAVVVTGGEPTLQADLIGFLQKLKARGFSVKLDTNGSHPEVLKQVFKQGLVDYVAMDVKAPLHKYHSVTDVAVDAASIRESIALIISSGIEHEFRTTVLKSDLLKTDIVEIGTMLHHANRFVLQRFVDSKCLNKTPDFETYSDEEFAQLADELRTYVKVCLIR